MNAQTKTANMAMDYESTPIKKVLKTGRKVKRDERKLGELGVGGLLFYVLFWRVIVPNYGLLVTLALVAETTLVIMHIK